MGYFSFLEMYVDVSEKVTAHIIGMKSNKYIYCIYPNIKWEVGEPNCIIIFFFFVEKDAHTPTPPRNWLA